MPFTQTVFTVLILLFYAIPGFVLVKCKAIKSQHIPSFAKFLLYVCQPCLSIYSFQKVTYSPELLRNMGIFVGLNLAVMLLVLVSLFLLFRKNFADVRNRVATVASALGNVGFLGVPLLESLLPDFPEAVAYSAVFIVCMNILSWTVGSAMLTGDKKYINLKKVFINPPVLTLLISLPLFFTGTRIPGVLFDGISLFGKMTTPLCMLILGMRFATVPPKELISDWRPYFTSAIKLVVMPFLAYLLTHWLPIDYVLKATIFILCCCPTASVVLNLGEIYGVGQKTAANTLLLTTLFSMLTIPLMLLIL